MKACMSEEQPLDAHEMSENVTMAPARRPMAVVMSMEGGSGTPSGKKRAA